MPRPVAVQVVQLIVVALIGLAVVRALMPRGGASEPEFRRRRAEWLTVTLGLVAVSLVVLMVLALTGDGGVNPYGILPFLALCVHLAISVPILRRVWRSAVASAQESAPVEPEQPPSRHTGLSGEDLPPTRW